ncbi:L1 [Anas platyrhynchos papillomavirus 2]|nr:L1 [Anas platyrhynchos papillomavirus 2]
MSLNTVNGQPYFLAGPQTSTALLHSTDQFVQETNLVFHGSSDKLFLVGHPYSSHGSDPYKGGVPKCSAYQYRVFRINLPDPHTLSTIPTNTYDPSKERMAFKLVGLEVTRDAPLAVGVSGSATFNGIDPGTKEDGVNKDHRVGFAFDSKQSQMLIVGCVPPIAQHWDRAARCEFGDLPDKTCPGIENVVTLLNDGDMCDMGFGNMNFKALDEDGQSLPIELRNQTSKYPDFVKMMTTQFGNACFWYLKREQLFCKNVMLQPGTYPEVLHDDAGRNLNHAYFNTPSGSLVSSDTQLFNKPYWLSRAQGSNNGMLWGNTLFVTVLDTTRNTIFNVNIRKKGANSTYDEKETYRFLRHTEQFTIQVLVRVCVVALNTQTLTYLNTSAPYVLPQWGIGNDPPVLKSPEDLYRYIASGATRCPDPPEAPTPAEDPFSKVKSWEVDMTKKLSADLQLTPLGRKFLGYLPSSKRQPASSKTPASTPAKKKTVKRKRGV